MSFKTPKNHLFLPEDLPLYELGYIFSNCSVWYETGTHNRIATFDLVIRDMPKNRNFLIFSGIEEIICALEKWKYSNESVKYLLNAKIITKKFAKYLKDFKFSGDIHAMPEGTIFFPKEPVIRITAPIIEANLIGSFLTNAVFSNTIYASKAIRSVIAAKNKLVIGAVSARSHGFESSYKCGRASFIVGATGGTPMPGFSKKYDFSGKEPSINLACHAYITSFPDEISAMREITKRFEKTAALMIDTYEFNQGLKNAIRVGEEMKKQKKNLFGIIIDSGDIFKLSFKARKELDKAGLNNTKIIVASNLDEYKIKKLSKQNAPIDSFIAATEIGNVTDDPKLEIVYKLAMIKKGKQVKNCAKFSPGKQTYPGSKQVFRIFKSRKFHKDIIGLENEKLGIPLLIPMVKKGETIYKLPNLLEIRKFIKRQIKSLPPRFLSINKQSKYKVEFSKKINNLVQGLKNQHQI